MERKIYLNANVTTKMPEDIIKIMIGYFTDQSIISLLSLKQKIAAICDFKLTDYELTFTNSATESNIHIITAAARSYNMGARTLPHIIISNNEIKAINDCLLRLQTEGLCQYTILKQLDPDSLNAAIRKSTCLISIAAANNETGIIANLHELAIIAHRENIPFHTDATQIFGRLPFLPDLQGVDAFSASFHRIGGPPGVGLMAIKRNFIAGYKLYPLIRGLDNIPLIATAVHTFLISMKNRDTKNDRIIRIKTAIISALNEHIKCFPYTDHAPIPLKSIDGGITPAPPPLWVESPEVTKLIENKVPLIFWIELKPREELLPNTLLFTIYSPNKLDIHSEFERNGIIIQKISTPLGLHPNLRNNIVSISVNDYTTSADIKSFVKCIIDTLS